MHTFFRSLILAALGFMVSPVHAQSVHSHTSASPVRSCGTESPGDEFEHWLQPLLKNTPASAVQRGSSTVYTIPVVFHVIHTGTNTGISYNISDAQILSQLDVLNADFRKLNADTATIPSVFSPFAADCEVNFCLAQRDTNGNPTTGINRVNINTITATPPALPYDKTFIDGTIKPATIWNVLNYLNIWVVPNMASGSTQLLGYATFPAGSGLTGLSAPYGNGITDGVVLWYRCTGRVGNLDPSYNKGRTATHEVGHWLGLRHIWGDANCGNDYCSDTPAQQTANFGNPVFPSTSNCLNNAPNGDMFMNYMDYCNDVSLKMFTAQQRTRIQTVLLNAPIRVAQRNSNACTPAVAGLNTPDESLSLAVYPNPANTSFTVSWSARADVKVDEVIVRNAIGADIAAYQVQLNSINGSVEIDTRQLSAGVYFLELRGPKLSRSQRFQVVH